MSSGSQQENSRPESDESRYVESQFILPDDWCKGTSYPTDRERFYDLLVGPCSADVAKYGYQIDLENPGLTSEEATTHLEYPLHRHTPFVDAISYPISRLIGLMDLREQGAWGPDVILKAFDDLDLAVFGGVLRHHCTLRWRSEEFLLSQRPSLRERIHNIMCLPRPYIMKTKVQLVNGNAEPQLRVVELNMNATAIFLAPPRPGMSYWDEMWGALLEGMIRAYFYVVVGAQLPESPLDNNVIPYIRRCLVAVSRFTQKFFDMQAGGDLVARMRIKDEVAVQIAASNLQSLSRGSWT